MVVFPFGSVPRASLIVLYARRRVRAPSLEVAVVEAVESLAFDLAVSAAIKSKLML